jgi:hypothetical protein
MTLLLPTLNFLVYEENLIFFFISVTSTASQDGDEEAALEDFKAAAGLGSGYAKSMLVEMNPYAAMCNAMLR